MSLVEGLHVELPCLILMDVRRRTSHVAVVTSPAQSRLQSLNERKAPSTSSTAAAAVVVDARELQRSKRRDAR